MSVITLHIIESIPWSNLNRDDTGTPKSTLLGGVRRGMLSSQSIKRAARTAYEVASLDTSYRSGNLIAMVLERVIELAPDIDAAKAEQVIRERIDGLTVGKGKGNGKSKKSKAKSADDEAEETQDEQSENEEQRDNRSIWLSAEEIETLAASVAAGKDGEGFIAPGMTGSLAIAAFGRMFAQKPDLGTEAAIAVSPAVSTHLSAIEIDYFSTVDDYPAEANGAGATHLGEAFYTSGIFYRSVTIDPAQLAASWTGFGSSNARQLLSELVDAIIWGLPKGKKNHTAPYTGPLVVVAEQQRHRVAYDFETPVHRSEGGGYTENTIDALKAAMSGARRFDPANFGKTVVSGRHERIDELSDQVTSKEGLIDIVTDWVLQ